MIKMIHRTAGAVAILMIATFWLSTEICDLDRTYPSLLERGLRVPTLTIIIRLGYSLGITPAEPSQMR